MSQLPPTMSIRHTEQQERDPLMQFVKRWWWLLAIGAVIGIAAAVTYSKVGPVPYESTALIQVVTPSGSTTTQNAEQARSASMNFAAEVSSQRIYALVSDALVGTLDVSVDDLEAMERSGSIAISPLRTSNFIRIVVTDPDPDRAELLANTISTVFVADVSERSKLAFEARQAQVDEQIQFTRDQLATSALRQRENDLEATVRDRQSALLNLQTSYQQELTRQAESDAIGGRSAFSESELVQQVEVRNQLLRAIGQQVTDTEANIASLTEELATVREELATLPPDADGSLSAAFTTAYTLQLSALTERYVTDQITALTSDSPVYRYGDASTPFASQGIKKLGAFGLMGGLAVAAGFGMATDLFRTWRLSRAQRSEPRQDVAGSAATAPEFERLLAMVDELATRGDFGPGRRMGAANRPTTAGD